MLDTYWMHAGYMRDTAGYMRDTYLGGSGECIDAIIMIHVQRTYLRSTCIRIGLEIRNLKCIPMYPICIPLDTRSDLSVK